MPPEEKPVTPPATPPDLSKDLATMKTENAALMARLEALEGKKKDPPEDPELIQKAKDQRALDDKKSLDEKQLESAIRFGLKSEEFLKTNASLLPKDVADIFKTADKEKYSNQIEKDAAIKSGIVQSFFSVQANMDLLTGTQKTVLDEYLKLTKTSKQDKAQHIFDTIFEPTFEMLRRIKKAEALNKGFGAEGDSETAYKNRMIALSRKHYLGEKSNA